MQTTSKKKTRKWYERYLPFVARSTEGQLEWLVAVLKKEVLSLEEIAPYVTLLFAEKNSEELDFLVSEFGRLSDSIVCRLLNAANIYDTPKLFRFIPQPDTHHAEIALRKDVPPYEKKRLRILDRVFYAINAADQNLLEKVANKMIREGDIPEDFTENYERFLGILKDEEFLLSLYPNAGR